METSPFEDALAQHAPYAPGAPAGPRFSDGVRARIEAAQRALGNPAGRAWIEERLAQLLARPSYTHGDSFDHVAFLEGQKAALRAIKADINTILPTEEG
jgi:hypothetical protein